MELIEMIGWIGIGFVPMLAGLQVISKTRKRFNRASYGMDLMGGEKVIGI
jgi:hypothetical protein